MLVRMYSRTTCGLCDEAREAIQSLQSDLAFEFEEVFVDGDDAMEREYGLRVPVVLVDGVERFEVQVQVGELRGLLGA
ncbi:MAG: glutaredoxin family protein [Actinomycetota bacterium]